MIPWLVAVLLFCCLAGYLVYLRWHHARVFARDRERVMKGDRSIRLEMTRWATLREVPVEPENEISEMGRHLLARFRKAVEKATAGHPEPLDEEASND